MEKRIFDPPIPFISPIYEGIFNPQKLIRILGTVPSDACRFNVNLQCDTETNIQNDIALQILVQLQDGYIALNSMNRGIWGNEQREVPVPIQRSKNFEIILQCDVAQYKITLNAQDYYEFPQRIHYSRITHIAIDGNVSIVQISYESVAESEVGTSSTTNHESSDPEVTNISSTSLLKTYYRNPLSESPPPPYETVVTGANSLYVSSMPTNFSVSHPRWDMPGIPCISRSSLQPSDAVAGISSPASNVQFIRRSRRHKCLYYLCSIVFGLAFIIAMVFIKMGRT